MENESNRNEKILKIMFISNFKTKYLLKINKLTRDPISQLVSNYKELEIYLKHNKLIFKNLYLNIKNINNILYDSENIIEIRKQDYNQSLTQYFYLTMLINENKHIVNISYSFDLIREINEENKKCIKKLKKILVSKIILDLIDNYKGLDIDEIIDDKEIETIKNRNKLIIKDNLKFFKEFDLKYNEREIEEIRIDDLYVDIIYSLIKSKKIENYKYVIKIFNQMSLNSIDVSKKIYEKLLNSKFFNSEYIKNFSILNQKDLCDDKKINFYSILFNYIIKDSIFIYQIPFLIKSRIFILSIIKSNLDSLLINIPKKWAKKICLIIKKMADCEFYKKKINNYLDKTHKTKPNNNTNIHNSNNNNINNINNYNNNITIINNNILSINNNISNYNNNNISNINNNISNYNNNISNYNNNISNYNTNFNNNISNYNNNFSNYNTNFSNYNNNFSNININVSNINNNISNYELNMNNRNYSNLNSQNNLNDLFRVQNSNNNKKNSEIIKLGNNTEINYKTESIVLKSIKVNNDEYLKFNNTIKLEECGNEFPNKSKNDNGFRFIKYLKEVDINKPHLLEEEDNDIKLLLDDIYYDNNIHENSNEDILIYFEHKKSFKVNRICPLFDKNKKETNYYLVAGHNNNKIILKLYKLYYDNNCKDMKMEYIDDILAKKNKTFIEFKSPIKYIKQSKKTGNIIIYTSKKVFIFSPPNLTKYLLYEEYKEIENFDYLSKENVIEESILYDNIT